LQKRHSINRNPRYRCLAAGKTESQVAEEVARLVGAQTPIAWHSHTRKADTVNESLPEKE
jgi:hypothetical protein